MRMTKERTRVMALAILERLQGHQLFEVTGSKDKLVAALEKVIADELSVEERLNDETRSILKAYEAECDNRRVDYQTMFTMVKKKLVKERGLIL